ncbi:MAG: hypothetical protein AAB281_00350, partial [Actinomycetota bacterium]
MGTADGVEDSTGALGGKVELGLPVSAFLDLLREEVNSPPAGSCPNPLSGVLVGSGPDGEARVCRVPCKNWACEVCGPKRGRLLRRGMLREVRGWSNVRLLSLTLDPKKMP